MKVHVCPDEGAAARRTAAMIAQGARAAIAAKGSFRLALAGGSTPKLAYEHLAAEPEVPWHAVEIFFGDERMVAPDDGASNFDMTRRALLSRVPVAAERVHRMQGELPAERAARDYEAVLGETPLDLVLLGMGTDGHTASLFPGRVAEAESRRVIATEGPPPNVERVTLTVRALREASTCVFLVTGAAKADRVREVFSEVDAGHAELPASRVALACRVEWILDQAAASYLPLKGP